MAIPEARPTEYKGIRYRSKCEAMFARYLELELSTESFSYEPWYLEVDKWIPDFIRWCTYLGGMPGFPGPCLLYEIIEYKPSRPTETYRIEFLSRFKKLQSRLCEDGFPMAREFRAAIYYGSVFTNDRGLWQWIPDGPHRELTLIASEDYDWLGEYETEVKNTRFDLESVSSM